MRNTLTFTIDQKMRRILMMLSFKLENGNYEIIHIADVSYYLEEGTIWMMKRIKSNISLFSG
jgi:exoribonuclease R